MGGNRVNDLAYQDDSFRIADDSTAEWAIRKIREAQQDTQMWTEHFAAQMQAISNKNRDTINYMTEQLRSYFYTVPHKKSMTQSQYKLPDATLVLKQQNPEYLRDNDALLRYADENKRPELVRVKREPNWEAIKAASIIQGDKLVDTETGEIIQGVKLIVRPDKFEVKIKEDLHDGNS